MGKIKKILITARGEIAVRIIRTCKEMEIKTVTVFSSVDRALPHVKLADETYNIGENSAYLDIDKLIEIAKKTKADAIHAGYGFLAENAEFAEECRNNGIIFIGPAPELISLMASKIQAREALKNHDIPVVPGLLIDDFSENSNEALFKTIENFGFPILIKADLGGGGKGIKLVNRIEDFYDLAKQASGEAQRSFGNGRVYIEKFLENPKHIEIQVMSDKHGNHFHIFERECSVQRANQKIIEETSSPTLDEKTREKMLSTAVEITKAIEYENLGTIEFLLDKNGQFYFLEMNTRLQVEHPITEMVTGLDMVKIQIEIAEGKNFSDFKAERRGHAIECRVCAECPDTFIPTTGEIYNVCAPLGPFTRVDCCLSRDMKVTPLYDSMLSKIIVWADNRNNAIARMKRALNEYKIFGVQTNIPLHLEILDHPEFLDGTYGTSFIKQQFANRSVEEPDLPAELSDALLAAAACEKDSAQAEKTSMNGLTEDGSRWKYSHRYRRSLRP